MASRALEDELDARREEAFVDREGVSDLLAIAHGEAKARVGYLKGGPGVGKTALLRAIARRARAERVEIVWFDARDLPGGPASVAEILGAAIAKTTGPFLLVLDSFEARADLERWWRDSFLPSCPVGARILFAGRIRLDGDWHTDPGWRGLLAIHELAPLAPADAELLLCRLDVPDERRAPLVELAHGNPLVLSLLAELGDGERLRLPSAALSQRLLRGVPTPEHTRALQATALAPPMTEDLLACMLERGDASSLYRWLARQVFIEQTPRGLKLADPMGRALHEELTHRTPVARTRLLSAADRFRQEQAKSLEPPVAKSTERLDEASFRQAIKAALRVIDRPELLAQSPLLDCRLVEGRVSADAPAQERVDALAGLLREACERLERSPRDRTLYRALDKAFLHPAPKQEAAARELGVGYSTYRRHLSRALARIAGALWLEEHCGGRDR